MIIQFDLKLDQKVKHMNRYPDINISDQCGMVRRGIMCLIHMTCVITAICRQRYPARRHSIDSLFTLTLQKSKGFRAKASRVKM